jgi:hypothetical protein
MPQTSKHTEIIEGDVKTTVSKIIEILKTDIKAI